MPAIDGSARDNTEDWIVPRRAVPTIAELEARIDEAVVIARVSEEGVREVGDMALDAARQARRAAEAAEQSARSAAALSARPAGRGGERQSSRPEERASREVVIDPLERFNRRADAIAARLKRLQQVAV